MVDAKLPKVDYVDYDIGVDFVDPVKLALNAWVCCTMSINVFQYFGIYVEFAKLVLRLCTVFQNRAAREPVSWTKHFAKNIHGFQ